MYKTSILERASLNYIINLLQRDTACMDDSEQDYQMMQQDLLVEGEALQLGVKAGLKLMKELEQL